jgi:Beta-propeller repeat
MKIRGSAVTLVWYAAIVLLAGGFLLLAGFGLSKNLSHKKSSATSVARNISGPAKNNFERLRDYGKLPLSFIENQGQTAQEVRYVSHGSQYDLFLTSQEAVLALTHSAHRDLSPRHRHATLRAMMKARHASTTTTALRMRLEGANPDPQIAGAGQLPGRVNYFIGNDPKKWHTGIPTYAQVKYSQVYPGVDLVFYGNQRKLEYDFIVAPGTDPKVIRMNLAGAKKLRLDAQGNVLLKVAGGEVQLQKPVIYQNVDGQRREIAGSYSLRGQQVSFAVANYDRRQPLIVDPVLNYSTYLGGELDDDGLSVAVDGSGDAFVAGFTSSLMFPTLHGLSLVGNTNDMGFVTEVNPLGTALLNSTYLGGTAGGDAAFGVALDPTGNVYVTGFTASTDFPTTDGTAGTVAALKQSLNLGNALGTSFLTKLSPTFTLLYSTYLGGTQGDQGDAVAADSTGNAYVTGLTLSDAGTGSGTDADNLLFPILNGYQTTLTEASGSAFLTRIDTTKTGSASLIYSTYLQGTGANTAALGFGDEGFGVVADGSGHAYVAGTTTSTDFLSPLPAATKTFQSSVGAGNLWGTGFVAEVDTTQSGNNSLLYSSYVGGGGSNATAAIGDFAQAIDLQSGTGVVYVTGSTGSSSATFPLLHEFDNTADQSLGAGFAVLLDTSVSGMSSLQYGTFFGPGGSLGFGIKADSAGHAFVVGGTAAGSGGSPSFPTTPGAFQPSIATGASGDGFLTELDTTGTGCSSTFPCAAELIYSTYFGGNGAVGSPDLITALALNGSSTPPIVVVTGQTSATNLPVFPPSTATPPAFQTALNGTSDAFVASLTLEPTLIVSPLSLSFTATAIGTPTAAQTVTLTNNTSTAIPFTSATITNASPAGTDFAVSANTCGTSIPASGGTCTVSVTFTASTTSESATLTLTDGDSTSPQSVALTGTAPAPPPPFTVLPATLTFVATAQGAATASQTVTLTNNGSTAVNFTSAVVTLTSATGAAADFALTPTCSTTTPIAASGGTCSIGVVYTPSTTATETATLTIVDSDANSPHTVALTGSVQAVAPNFTLAVAPTSLTVARGASGTSTITVTSVGSFNAAVALSCAGQPTNSTCMISPSSVTPTAGGMATATLTFATVAMLAPPVASPKFPMGSIKVIVPMIMLVLMVMILLASEQRLRLRTRLTMAGALLAFAVLAGCGSGSNHGTPPGTSTLTITATSAGLTSQTATVSVTVTK